MDEDRAAAGKGRPSVPSGRRRSAESLETRRDHRAVDGKRWGHEETEFRSRCGLMDKAPASGAGDCGFESRHR
ncbi:Speckle-type POZ protein [Trichinella spiralis]|uniref:Speckle-type POZ protein n=1 Tax=Trichinella spiralis TaxID=6334 RepID=A0ABR3K4U8_TRISP